MQRFVMILMGLSLALLFGSSCSKKPAAAPPAVPNGVSTYTIFAPPWKWANVPQPASDGDAWSPLCSLLQLLESANLDPSLTDYPEDLKVKARELVASPFGSGFSATVDSRGILRGPGCSISNGTIVHFSKLLLVVGKDATAAKDAVTAKNAMNLQFLLAYGVHDKANTDDGKRMAARLALLFVSNGIKMRQLIESAKMDEPEWIRASQLETTFEADKKKILQSAVP